MCVRVMCVCGDTHTHHHTHTSHAHAHTHAHTHTHTSYTYTGGGKSHSVGGCWFFSQFGFTVRRPLTVSWFAPMLLCLVELVS